MTSMTLTAPAAPVRRGQPSTMHAGQAQAWSFEQIYEVWQLPIFTYILRLVGNREQAEDLTQETFLKAFRALPKMSAGLQLAAWLYRIGTNTALDALRRSKLIAFQPWQNLGYEPAAGGEGLDPLTICETQELIRVALHRMPQGYRVALLAYRVDGRSHAEIARMLGIAPKGVKTYLSRATSSFLRHYRELGGEVARDARRATCSSRKREDRAS